VELANSFGYKDKFKLVTNWVENKNYRLEFDIETQCFDFNDVEPWGEPVSLPNQNELFNQLKSWNFPISLPEGSWKDLNEMK
jgi:hypothetical protein